MCINTSNLGAKSWRPENRTKTTASCFQTSAEWFEELKMKLKTVKDEMLRKLGRNLLHFQQLEKILKFLVINGEISGNVSNMKQNQLKRSESVGKQTLGMVAGQFFEQNQSDLENDDPMPIESQKPYLRVRFQFDTENPDPEGKVEALSRLVAARNELVHHILDRVDLKSKQSLIDTNDHLDKQRDNINLELDYYRDLVASLHEGRRQCSELLMSDEFGNLLMGKNESPKGN